MFNYLYNFFVVFEGEAVGGAVVGGEVAAARQLGEETVSRAVCSSKSRTSGKRELTNLR